MKNLTLTTIFLVTFLMLCGEARAQDKYIVYIHIPAQIPSTLQNYITVEKPFVWYISEVPADSYKSVTGWIVFYLGEEETGRFTRENIIGWRKIIDPLPEPTPDPIPEPEAPVCSPEWCSAALIPCTDTPIQGVDSCGKPCTKPSPEWPNCKNADGTTGQLNFGVVN